ncbi:MAG: hypothetical protein GEU98_00155 [Pseudonocardiaceae bacterium]|nr:hypothetical protein [Pseudonocardiaceae bacterium]
MAQSTWLPGGGTLPSIAEINDCWLEGAHHTEAAREAASQIAMCAPHIPYLVRSVRSLLGRVVKFLLARGVRQFLDLGAGVPAVGHIHEVAWGVDPECRIVYVDFDPAVAQEGRTLLADNDNVAYLCDDIRHPRELLDNPELRNVLDLSRPVAVFMLQTLQELPDSEDPVGLVAAYSNAISTGSYVCISHFGSKDEQLRNGLNLFGQMGFGAPPAITFRDPDQLTNFFAGLELIDPGVVPVPLWYPDSKDDIDHNPHLVPVHVGLGRKP